MEILKRVVREDKPFKKQNGLLIWIILALIFGLQIAFINPLTVYAEITLDVTSSGSIEPSKTLNLHPYSYIQDFESEDPFQKWATNGTYTVNYKGVTTERASSGKQSFKIDITFDTTSYIYWKIPVKIPSIGELNFKGDIHTLQIAGTPYAALGTNVSRAPWKHTGVNILQLQKIATEKWITQRSDLVDAGLNNTKSAISKYLIDATYEDVGIWCDKIALFLMGKKGDRITVYVDNIEVKGEVPDSDEYTNITNLNWSDYQQRMNDNLNALTKNITAHRVDEIEKIKESVEKRGYILVSEYKLINEIIEDSKFQNLPENMNSELLVYPWDPTSHRMVLPDMFPIPSLPGNTLELTACPDEYEPASLIIRTKNDLSNITITKSDLLSEGGNIIPSSALDIKIVKSWYQANIDSIRQSNPRKKYLVPELLLNDDTLIKVDEDSQTNFLRIELNNEIRYINITNPDFEMPANAVIKDAIFLKPFDLKSETNKQIWLTLKVPKNAKPDLYKGKLQIKAMDTEVVEVEVKANILDFKLPTPALEYSIYYAGQLTSKESPPISYGGKNSTQYRVEFDNMKKHGLSSATIYQKPGSKQLKNALQIRADAGMNGDNLYVLGTKTGNPTGDAELKKLKDEVSKWMEIAKEYNYKNVFIYGIDEGNLDIIRSQKQAWEIVHKTGAGIFVACPPSAVDIANGLLNIGVLSKSLDSEAAEKCHAGGAKVFSYGNPQVGVENSYIYRKNYGIDLWLAGYDGALNYAYQRGMGNIWNDFDHNRNRDHVFAYPVTDDVINTIQWEGFREAIDDVRYLTKLLSTGFMDEASLKEWFTQMQSDGYSLSHIRENIIQKIITHK